MAQHVLVPVLPTYLDPDRVTHCAIPYGRALAARQRVPLVLGSVVELGDYLRSFLEAEGERAQELARRWAAEREEALRRLAQAITDVPVKIEVRVGDPARQIAAMADELPASVVAMTSHARIGISRLLVGSVTFSAVQRIGCPVLVVRARTPAPAPNTMVTLTPVLVPLDGSSPAEESLDAVVRVLGADGLALHLLHVQTAATEGRDWETYLQNLAQRLSSQGMTVTWSVRQGHVAETIAQAAAETKSGLIAMATHGRSGLRRALLGSTAEHVLHNARVPLLLVRPSLVKRPEEAPVPPAAVSAGGEEPELDARRLTLRARDVMTSPVVTVSPDETLEHVARTMLEHGIGAAPVVDQDGRLVGIITERDLMAQEQGVPFSVYRAPQLFGHWLPPEGLEEIYSLGRTIKAKEVMRSPVITVGEDATVSEIAQLMLEKEREHIPVVRDGQVVGMVTRHDLLKLLARSM